MRLKNVAKESSNQAIRSQINLFHRHGLLNQYQGSRPFSHKLEMFLCTLNKDMKDMLI